ncbi:MAG: hypothetical protein NVS1B10_07340 [Candidatus Saccharimonadales bacterium]
MPTTYTNLTGDGQSANLIQANIQVPDSGYSVSITGVVQVVGQSVVSITGSPLTFPSAPASGIINVIIQINSTTGAASIKQNTTAGTFPTPDAGNIQVFQTVLGTTSTDLALDASNQTPDTV